MFKDLNRDLIYLELIENSDRYNLEIDAEFVEDDYRFLPYPEIIKRRLLRSKYLSLDKLAYPVDVLQLLLLHRDFITTEQIRTLKLFSNNSTSIPVRLARLQKPTKASKAILASQYIDKNRDGVKVYYLTPYGREKLRTTLPESYLQNNMIDIDKNPSMGNLAHDTELLNLFYHLIVDEKFIDFQWLPGVPMTNIDTLNSSFSQYNQTAAAEITGSVKPDAMIIPWEDNFEGIIYVEQDMRTERVNQLTEKFNRYDSYLDHHDVAALSNALIIFSTKLDTAPSQDKTSSKIDSNPALKLQKSYNELKKFMSSKNFSNLKEMDKELERLLLDAKHNNGGGNTSNTLYHWYTQLHKFLSSAFHFNTNMSTLKDLEEFIEHKKILFEELDFTTHLKSNTKQLAKRMQIFSSAVQQAGLFKEKLLNGLSVLACDSNHLNTLPYLFIKEYKTYEPISNLVKKKYLTNNAKHTYSPFKILNTDQGTFVLKNAIHLPAYPEPIFIENISQDIGGELRVRRYIENGLTNVSNTYLCLLVKNELDAIEFSNLLQLAERFRDKENPKLSTCDVHIIFISYETEESALNLFIVDHNGKVLTY